MRMGDLYFTNPFLNCNNLCTAVRLKQLLTFFTAVSVVYGQYSLGPKFTFICCINIWFIFNQADALTFHIKVILLDTFVARFPPCWTVFLFHSKFLSTELKYKQVSLGKHSSVCLQHFVRLKLGFTDFIYTGLIVLLNFFRISVCLF